MFLRGATGGVVVSRVESPSDHVVKAEVQGKDTDDWFCVEITVTADPPHGLTDFEMYFIPTPERVKSTRRLSEAEALADLGAYVDRLAAADQFSGVVLVARDREPIFTRAHGQASKAYGVPNRLDTKFNLASMNKMFTAVAIVQLAERGKLAYTDTIARLLPDYPNKDVARRVTIHQLLTHTSGLGDYFNPKWEAKKPKLRAVREYFPLFVDEPLGFEPGTTFGYSNAGYIVLGAIIEKVSGQSYYDYVREHVYQPAGMADTDSFETDVDVPNRAQGYTRMGPDHRMVPGPWRNNIFAIEPRGGPAGGGYSTAGDLLRFALALRDNTLLDSRSTESVLSEQVKDDRGGGYGYGFQVDAVRGRRIVGHSGGFAGVHSKLDIYRDSGYVVVVLSNYDRGAARIIDRLRDMLTRVE
jgi:CubicO group peptidase (beta-lactamase class C family)